MVGLATVVAARRATVEAVKDAVARAVVVETVVAARGAVAMEVRKVAMAMVLVEMAANSPKLGLARQKAMRTSMPMNS